MNAFVIPKTVLICGEEYKVIRRGSGGAFHYNKKEIWVEKHCRDEWEYFIHEVIEGILDTRLLRFAIPRVNITNEDYRFILTHREFELAAKDISIALKRYQRK